MFDQQLWYLLCAAVAAAMEPILQAILGMRPMRDPELLTMQARALESLAGFLAARPACMPPVLQKVLLQGTSTQQSPAFQTKSY